VVTLASGALLRYQWTGAPGVPVHPRHLLHAHSHVALLGWAFAGVFGLLLAASPAARDPGSGMRRAEGSFHLVVAALFVAFLLQGYAFGSILLSTLHMGVALAAVIHWLRQGRPREEPEVRPWLDLAVLGFVLASLGPWMLAFGGRMGPSWTDAWVGYYLALLFHGWLTFAVFGLLARQGEAELSRWCLPLLGLGVLPSVLPRMSGLLEGPGVAWVGWVGSVIFGAGLAMGAVAVARGARGRGWREGALPGSVAVAGILAGGSLAVGTFPAVAPAVLAQRNLVVGYVHLLLLGFVGSALVHLLHLGRPGRSGAVAVALFLGGSWFMIGLLLVVGCAALLGTVPRWPVAWMLTWGGVVALAGGVGLAPARASRAAPGPPDLRPPLTPSPRL
jgi:hypothetical protein